jgi:ADP-heptose:LPS heptosyltransferase
MFPYVKKKQIEPISLKEHFLRRNKVLIKRKYGGHGDIIMQRMMFEDFQKHMPEIELTYTCPKSYKDFANNHPFAKWVPIEEINERDYGIIFDISTACRVHESKMGGRNTDHRSDIWAKSCGVELTNHNCHMEINDVDLYKKFIEELNPQKLPTVLFATQSTKDNFGQAKSLPEKTTYQTISKLKELGFFVFTIHKEPIEIFTLTNTVQFINIELSAWAGLTAAADYVISIDTGTFHLAGALKKPLVGIFSFTDGKVYGKYYKFALVQRHRDNGKWDCGPCYNCTICPKSKEIIKPCMSDIRFEEIIDAFQKECKAN